LSGWICSYRKIWENPFFKGNGMRVAIWHWLLHKAAFADTTHKIGSAEITVKRGEVCFSQQQLCDETGASRRQVRDVLDFLISSKSASKIGANERANKGANVRANAKTLLVIEKYDEYQAKNGAGANEWANKGATEGPTKEQVNNKQDILSRDFGLFWDAYPHRGGAKKGRAKAEAKYTKLVASGIAEADIIAGAKRYATDRQVRDGFAKDPVTWLNQSCWQDEVEVSPLRAISGGRKEPEYGERRIIEGVKKIYMGFDGWIRDYG
jgi:hypothetical protein